MAPSPKSQDAGETKRRRAVAASVLLLFAVCGAVVAVVMFRSVAETSPEMTSISTKADAGCETKLCKAGGTEVCGTDGKVYLNDCFFKNAQCRDATLQAVADWKGYNCPNTCKKRISCKEIGKFLCATDGNVYFGYCNLYTAQCLDETIQEVPCDPAIFDGAF
ncbi:hypothetical protein ATCC90586_006160 [Pythium insidiosum]|nr:hypothetical protein ATCC90586_006160 [Pythium insidiosum]